MLGTVWQRLYERASAQDLVPVKRDFDPPYLRDTSLQKEFARNGYCLVPECVPMEFIRRMQQLYTEFRDLDGIPTDGRFFSSGNLTSPQARTLVQETIKTASRPVLERIADPANCLIDTGGALQVKPPSDTSALGPHQDNPLIDEEKEYAMYVWVPMQDVDEGNGTICVLPGSHLWGNHQRSRTVPWAFGRHERLIRRNMVPLQVRAGDAVCFDSAMIHSSTANLSNETRLAVSMVLFPLEYDLVHHYHRDSETPPGMVEKYLVDEDFYIRQDVLKRPGAQYEFVGLQDWTGRRYYSKSSIRRLIGSYQPQHVKKYRTV